MPQISAGEDSKGALPLFSTPRIGISSGLEQIFGAIEMTKMSVRQVVPLDGSDTVLIVALVTVAQEYMGCDDRLPWSKTRL